MCENIRNNMQKTKKVELNEKDIKILNLIKRFLIDGENAEITEKEVHDYCKTMRWINRNFFKKENNYDMPNYKKAFAEKMRKAHCCGSHQKMGHGMIKGLSGLTWDLSKMPAKDAEEFKANIERDIAHDKMIHPEKYFGKTIYNKPNQYEKWDCCHEHNKERVCEKNEKRKDFSFDELIKLAKDFKKNVFENKCDCKEKTDKKELLYVLLLDLIKILKHKMLHKCHDKHCHCHCHDHHHGHECDCGCHHKHKKEISLIKVGNIINLLNKLK